MSVFFQIKEWRNSGDENARIVQAHLMEGLETPQGLRHDFKDFMDLVFFYSTLSGLFIIECEKKLSYIRYKHYHLACYEQSTKFHT